MAQRSLIQRVAPENETVVILRSSIPKVYKVHQQNENEKKWMQNKKGGRKFWYGKGRNKSSKRFSECVQFPIKPHG